MERVWVWVRQEACSSRGQCEHVREPPLCQKHLSSSHLAAAGHKPPSEAGRKGLCPPASPVLTDPPATIFMEQHACFDPIPGLRPGGSVHKLNSRTHHFMLPPEHVKLCMCSSVLPDEDLGWHSAVLRGNSQSCPEWELGN